MTARENYHLQRLLEFRARAREQAIEVLAEKRAQSAAAERELQTRENAVTDCRNAQRRARTDFAEKSAQGIKNSRIIVHRDHLNDLRERENVLLEAVAQQRLIVERAASEVEKSLLALTEATKELQAIEKHRENWRAAKKIEINRKEQKKNDEIGAILHERNKIE